MEQQMRTFLLVAALIALTYAETYAVSSTYIGGKCKKPLLWSATPAPNCTESGCLGLLVLSSDLQCTSDGNPAGLSGNFARIRTFATDPTTCSGDPTSVVGYVANNACDSSCANCQVSDTFTDGECNNGVVYTCGSSALMFSLFGLLLALALLM